MRLSGVAGFILLISVVFVSLTLIILDFETNYIDTGISSATPFNQSLFGNLSDVSQLNDSVQPIKAGWDVVTEESGFFNRVLNFAVVIPIAIINVPFVIFQIMELGIARAIELLNILGIPIELIIISSVGIFIWVLFKLVSWWHRGDV